MDLMPRLILICLKFIFNWLFHAFTTDIINIDLILKIEFINNFECIISV